MSMNFATDVAVASGHTLKKAGYEIPFANSVAIVSNGNTHMALTSGEYVYVYNHSTLDEGLYVTTSSISQNGTLSSSNVSSITRGLGGQVTVLNNKLGSVNNSGTVLTNTSTGKASFTIPNGSLAFVAIAGYAPISVGMTNTGSIYNSTMPTGYTISQSGNTVTITKTTTVSTAARIVYIII